MCSRSLNHMRYWRRDYHISNNLTILPIYTKLRYCYCWPWGDLEETESCVGSINADKIQDFRKGIYLCHDISGKEGLCLPWSNFAGEITEILRRNEEISREISENKCTQARSSVITAFCWHKLEGRLQGLQRVMHDTQVSDNALAKTPITGEMTRSQKALE